MKSQNSHYLQLIVCSVLTFKISVLKYFTLFSTYIKDFCRYNADIIRTAVCLVQFSKLYIYIYMEFCEIELRSVREIFSS